MDNDESVWQGKYVTTNERVQLKDRSDAELVTMIEEAFIEGRTNYASAIYDEAMRRASTVTAVNTDGTTSIGKATYSLNTPINPDVDRIWAYYSCTKWGRLRRQIAAVLRRANAQGEGHGTAS